jgi:hypothetical protein
VRSAIAFFTSFLALGVFTFTSPANARSQNDPIRTPPAGQSPIEKQGLNFAVGERGLTSLSFNGQLLLSSAERGELQQWKSAVRQAVDWLFAPGSSPIVSPTKQTNSIGLAYSWGRIFVPLCRTRRPAPDAN